MTGHGMTDDNMSLWQVFLWPFSNFSHNCPNWTILVSKHIRNYSEIQWNHHLVPTWHVIRDMSRMSHITCHTSTFSASLYKWGVKKYVLHPRNSMGPSPNTHVTCHTWHVTYDTLHMSMGLLSVMTWGGVTTYTQHKTTLSFTNVDTHNSWLSKRGHCQR